MTKEYRKLQRFAVQLSCQFWSNTDKSDALNLSAQGCAHDGRATSVGLELRFIGYDLNDEEPAKIELAGVRWVSEH